MNENEIILTRVIELLKEAMETLGPEQFGIKEDIGWIVDEVRDQLIKEE